MPLVIGAFTFARDGKWLAGAGAGPEGCRAWDSREFESEGPSSNSGEEVALGITGEVFRLDIFDGPFVNVTVWNLSGSDRLANPGCRQRVDFVVVVQAFP